MLFLKLNELIPNRWRKVLGDNWKAGTDTFPELRDLEEVGFKEQVGSDSLEIGAAMFSTPLPAPPES
ncbi:hypothetical protein LY78DRAFT_655671 [Colletotrichum sublineola]|nr:hypothetical protein LY78DRAFT_655671 [Colletotrichum sublineola]